MVLKIILKFFFSRYFDGFCSNAAAIECTENNKVHKDSLKDVSNVIESQIKHQDKTTVEKLSDNSIAEIFEEDEDTSMNKTNEKENTLNTRLKHENTFNWKRKASLQDRFGFNSSKSLSSSPAVNKDFVNPLKNERNSEKLTHCAETISAVELKNTPIRKNPFAKTKTAEQSLSLASQNSLTGSDVLTPDSAFSEVSLL